MTLKTVSFQPGSVTSVVAGSGLTGGTITTTGTVAVNPTLSVTAELTTGSVSATPNLSFDASNTPSAHGATVAGSYFQVVLQNASTTAGASGNYVVTSDIGTDTTSYGEFGINSSVFSTGTPGDFYSINSGVYFSGHDGDISVGSGNGYKTYLTWGSAGQSAHVINAAGAIGFSTNLGTTPANTGTVGFGTAGQALITQGGTSAPSWGTLGVTGGGTGTTTSTGTGSVVLSNNPVFTTAINTPNLTLTQATEGYIQRADRGLIGFATAAGIVGQFAGPASGTTVNFLEISGAVAGSAPQIKSIGPDANLNIQLSPQGTGVVVVNNGLTVAGVAQSPYTAAPLFGTGADGAVTISSGTTTLTRDAHYTNLTISGSGVLKTGNFNVYVSGTLDISAAAAGAIINDGNSGSNSTTSAGGSAGTATTGRVLTAGGGGSTGSTGTIATGTTPGGNPAGVLIEGGNGGAGASGGTSGTAVAGSAAGSLNLTPIASLSFPSVKKDSWFTLTAVSQTGIAPLGAGTGGTGGGCGGGDGVNTGGGGGGGGVGGGYVTIYASTIARGSNTNTSIIRSLGGNGGSATATLSGTAGGGGGGGAGGGGFVYIVYGNATGSTITNCIDVSGGTGGTGGNGASTGKGGNGGTGGNGGNYQIINLGASTFTVGSFNAAGTAGSTTSTSTGAAGGAGAIVRGNL